MASHNYVCADFGFKGGSPAPTCSLDTLSFTGGTGVAIDGDGSAVNPNFPLSNSTTYYVTMIVTGAGTGFMYGRGDVADGAHINFSPGTTTITIVTGAGNSYIGLTINANSSFSGSISSLSISDTLPASATPRRTLLGVGV